MNKEKLLEMLNSQILPGLKEWLSITKDYAFDLFGRMQGYFIFKDTLSLIFWIILLILAIKIILKIFNSKNEEIFMYEWYDGKDLNSKWVTCILLSVFVFIAWLSLFIFWIKDLPKSIFIPELRIYDHFTINHNCNGN